MYHPTEKDIYFITELSKRGEDWPHFHEFPIGVSTKSQLIYVQRYVSVDIVEPTEFQVGDGQLRIYSFGREEVRCLSLIMTELAYYTFDGKRISCPLMYYVHSLLMRTRLVRRLTILLQQFCFALDRCRSFVNGRLHFPFAS